MGRSLAPSASGRAALWPVHRFTIYSWQLAQKSYVLLRIRCKEEALVPLRQNFALSTKDCFFLRHSIVGGDYPMMVEGTMSPSVGPRGAGLAEEVRRWGIRSAVIALPQASFEHHSWTSFSKTRSEPGAATAAARRFPLGDGPPLVLLSE